MKLSRGNIAKIEGTMVLATTLLILAALLFGCGLDGPRVRLLSSANPIVALEPSWPQRWSTASFDDYGRITGHREIDQLSRTLSLWPSVSGFVMGDFKIQSPWLIPPFAPSGWEQQRFETRAVYVGSGMSSIPALGDTIYGSVSWYDRSDQPHGTQLPDSLLPVTGTFRAYPSRQTYFDLTGESIGGATIMMVECTFIPGGVAEHTYIQWHMLAHEDSIWSWQ